MIKIKIGDIIVDTAKEPAMLIFTEANRQTLIDNLINMPPSPEDAVRKYCIYPDGSNLEEIKTFMKND